MPAVVLLDLKLPKLDGLEVLRRIRADERTAAPAGGHPDLLERGARPDRRATDLGANSYVRKPVDFGEFAEAVPAARPLLAGAQRAAPGRRGP